MTGAELEAMLRERRLGEAVIQRVLRLNPSPQPGVRLRGLRHGIEASETRIVRGWATKGAFIRRYGRAAFAALPAGSTRKIGRRVYVLREARR